MGREVGGGRSGWGTHVPPLLIHVNLWQKQPQYCKVISLQLKKKDSCCCFAHIEYLLQTEGTFFLIFFSFFKKIVIGG